MDFMHFIFPLFVEIGSHRESNTYVRRRNLEVAKTSFSTIISPVNGIESSGMSQTSQSGNQKNNTIFHDIRFYASCKNFTKKITIHTFVNFFRVAYCKSGNFKKRAILKSS